MTMIDLGPERPGHPSETRQMGEQGRAQTHQGDVKVSGRQFVIALIIIAIVIAGFALVLR
jgi:hypothetical protein